MEHPWDPNGCLISEVSLFQGRIICIYIKVRTRAGDRIISKVSIFQRRLEKF